MDNSPKLSGTWKGVSGKASDAQGIGDALAQGILSGAILEFKESGECKVSILLASQEGRYTINGDKLTIQLNSSDANNKLELQIKGDQLELVRKFDSDPRVIFEKQKPSGE